MADRDPERVVHTYDDDIEEHDNRLPLWWQYTLYGAVLFAVAYWIGEHKLGAWLSRREAFDEETATRLEEKGEQHVTPQILVAMSHTPTVVEAGRQVFTTTCAPCHRADGGGNIGPNLTDEYWIHGGKPENIYGCVHDGVPAKGMPTWEPVLGEQKVDSVVAYVLTLRNTHVAGGRPPQGEKAD